MSCRVQIEDTVFDTLKEAAAFLEVNSWDLSGMLNDNEEKIIKDMKVKRIDKRLSHLKGAIYCFKTGKMYRNAKVLARRLAIHEKYITEALRKDNKYVDRFGNTYRRVQNLDNFKDYSIIDDDVVDVKSCPTVPVKTPISSEPVSYVSTAVNNPEPVEESDTLEALNSIAIKLLNQKDYDSCGAILDVMKKLNKS